MKHTTYMPRVFGDAITGQADAPAQQFAAAWMALLGDRAHDKVWDDRLAHAAQDQANFLARYDLQRPDPHRGYLGSTANMRVRAAGYRLPAWMGDGNVVESAIRSWGDPAQAAHDLAHHDTHKDHMFMQGWWSKWGFRHYGVGAAEAVIDRGGVFFVCCTGVEE